VNEVALVQSDGSRSAVLGAAWNTAEDPDLIVARTAGWDGGHRRRPPVR
jgi:hypothetical protein